MRGFLRGNGKVCLSVAFRRETWDSPYVYRVRQRTSRAAGMENSKLASARTQ